MSPDTPSLGVRQAVTVLVHERHSSESLSRNDLPHVCRAAGSFHVPRPERTTERVTFTSPDIPVLTKKKAKNTKNSYRKPARRDRAVGMCRGRGLISPVGRPRFSPRVVESRLPPPARTARKFVKSPIDPGNRVRTRIVFERASGAVCLVGLQPGFPKRWTTGLK